MDSTQRFSNRVEAYEKYRPSYPAEALDYVISRGELQDESPVADIGAGTGIFSELLLERGVRVMAVEPNAEMAKAAWAKLGPHERFGLMLSPAEDTGMAGASVDAIVSAQAFHWFDQEAAKVEFSRILRPEGRVFLIWNTRLTSGTPFLERYEEMLQSLGTDYASVNHRNISSESLLSFFREGSMEEKRFANRQIFDYEGVKGRLLSSSYAPAEGEPGHEEMLEDLKRIFNETQQDGVVSFDYETEVYSGLL